MNFFISVIMSSALLCSFALANGYDDDDDADEKFREQRTRQADSKLKLYDCWTKAGNYINQTKKCEDSGFSSKEPKCEVISSNTKTASVTCDTKKASMTYTEIRYHCGNKENVFSKACLGRNTNLKTCIKTGTPLSTMSDDFCEAMDKNKKSEILEDSKVKH